MIKFEWDTDKAASNKKKHGVSFEEAQSVFYRDNRGQTTFDVKLYQYVVREKCIPLQARKRVCFLSAVTAFVTGVYQTFKKIYSFDTSFSL